MLKKIGLIAAIVFITIQLFTIDKGYKELNLKNDFLSLTKAPEEIKTLIQNSCYDCHSNQTNYPWYSNIAPVSWYIESHIKEAKHHLNFSEWSTYPLKKANHKLEECVEEIEEQKMPTSNYILLHSQAQLTKEQITILANWFKNQMR